MLYELTLTLYFVCLCFFLQVRLACNQFGFNLSVSKDFDAVRMYIVNNMTNSYFILFIQALFHPKIINKFRACCGRNAQDIETNARETQISEVVRQT